MLKLPAMSKSMDIVHSPYDVWGFSPPEFDSPTVSRTTVASPIKETTGDSR